MRASTLFLTLLLLLGYNGLAAEKPAFELLQPADKSIVKEGYISVIIKVNDRSVKDPHILSYDGSRMPLLLEEGKETYCQTLKLRYGKNKIRVRWQNAKGKLIEQTSEFYFTTPAYKTFQHIPKQFSTRPFHTPAQEALCAKCHDMSVNEKKGFAFINIEESNCYDCHKAITSEKVGHAPSVNWLCMSCHKEDKTAAAGASRFPTPERVDETCYLCHTTNKELWEKRRYKHQPEAGGKCNKCHNSHASENEFFLRKPVESLCTGCHGMQKVLERRSAQCFGSHCTDCHNPHATDRAFFIKQDYKP